MKYRSDKAEPQSDGAIVWHTIWMGGEPISKIENCRLATLAGDMRRTVHVTGEADTWFSIPAETSIAGCRLKGYITSDDGLLVFHHCYY